MVVYLLHFERPLHHAKHYLGCTNDLTKRLKKHRTGNGSKLMRAVTKAGIGFIIAKTWHGDRHFERWLHNKKNSPKFCPICQRQRHD
jgi:predicted GIY-YIG superfamily endonuclease